MRLAEIELHQVLESMVGQAHSHAAINGGSVNCCNLLFKGSLLHHIMWVICDLTNPLLGLIFRQ